MIRLIVALLITALSLFLTGGFLFLLFSFLGIVVSLSTLLPVLLIIGVIVFLPALILGGAVFAIFAVPFRFLFYRGRKT